MTRPIHLDRARPPRMTFHDTDGEPILAWYGRRAGWVLRVENFEVFPTGVSRFSGAFEALAKAKQLLAKPVSHAGRLPGRRIKLRAEHATDGNSYFLDATLEHDGSVIFSGQNVGPSIGYDGEYEYWVTVQAKHVAALAIALGGEPEENILDVLHRKWAGAASGSLGEAIKASGIDHNFINYY